ncbi:MAG: hypothetical protein R3349_07160, partial [Geminicoccaceae bacterium]|nr:hypothetical protein [Geminicoccaceae bacterium]
MSSSKVALLRGGALGLMLSLTACSGSAAPGPGELSGLRLAVATNRELDSHFGDYLAGKHARDIGEVAAAASYFERALAGAPDNVELLEELFLLTVAAGRFEPALAHAEDLIKVRPDSDEARLMLAAKAAKASDAATARRHLEAIGERGIAALATPFIDAWIIFEDGGPAAVGDAVRRLDEAEPLGPLNDYHAGMLQHLAGRPAEGLRLLEQPVAEGQRVPSRMAQ